jgi:hypothetical protein
MMEDSHHSRDLWELGDASTMSQGKDNVLCAERGLLAAGIDIDLPSVLAVLPVDLRGGGGEPDRELENGRIAFEPVRQLPCGSEGRPADSSISSREANRRRYTNHVGGKGKKGI